MLRYVLAFALVAVAHAQLGPKAFGNFRFKCSTATNCTQEQFCNAAGEIVTTPVVLTEGERLMAVPRLPCRRSDGSEGVCCRWLDYRDDWPDNYVDPGLRPRVPGSEKKPDADVRESELGLQEPERQYLPAKELLAEAAVRASPPKEPERQYLPAVNKPVVKAEAVIRKVNPPPPPPTTRAPPPTTRAPPPTTRAPPPPVVRADPPVVASTYLPPTTRAAPPPTTRAPPPTTRAPPPPTTRAPPPPTTRARPPPPPPTVRAAPPVQPDRTYLPVKASAQTSFFERRVAADEQPVTTSVASQSAAPFPSLTSLPSSQTPAAAPVPKAATSLLASATGTTERKVIPQQKVDAMIDALKTILKYSEPEGQKPRERTIMLETISRNARATPTRTNLLTGCPRRNRTALPDLNTNYDDSDFEAGAGEFPWNAAVLDRDGKLLCSAYFAEDDTVVTSASCVKGLSPSDLQVAVGVYDIRTPLAVTEPSSSPKPAQIVHVEAVDATETVAVLFLRETVQLNYYTLPICIDRQRGIPFYGFDDCVITGWGQDSTYHWFDVELLGADQCQRLVPGDQVSCARPHASADVCGLVERGAGLQCRYLGNRQSRKNDIYWLKGVFRGCSEGVLIYDHLDVDWFEMSLASHRHQS